MKLEVVLRVLNKRSIQERVYWNWIIQWNSYDIWWYFRLSRM